MAGSNEPNGRLSARDLSRAAVATVEELTGYEPEAVTGLEWDGDLWQVSVDVVELTRIPRTTDILATYVVQLDDTGTIRSYKRASRFQRGHSMEQ
jgi:Gas vesicle synthesis protein GvpO